MNQPPNPSPHLPSPNHQTLLSYERLDVYQTAMRFLTLSVQIIDSWPSKGHAPLVDQLRRAALSVPLNIAEASGKTTNADRTRYYAVARGSAMECAAVLEASAAVGITERKVAEQGRGELVRIVQMLTKMCR